MKSHCVPTGREGVLSFRWWLWLEPFDSYFAFRARLMISTIGNLDLDIANFDF